MVRHLCIWIRGGCDKLPHPSCLSISPKTASHKCIAYTCQSRSSNESERADHGRRLVLAGYVPLAFGAHEGWPWEERTLAMTSECADWGTMGVKKLGLRTGPLYLQPVKGGSGRSSLEHAKSGPHLSLIALLFFFFFAGFSFCLLALQWLYQRFDATLGRSSSTYSHANSSGVTGTGRQHPKGKRPHEEGRGGDQAKTWKTKESKSPQGNKLEEARDGPSTAKEQRPSQP